MPAQRLSLALTLPCALAALSPAIPSAAQNPPRSGEQILRSTCQTCHSLRPSEIKVGPSLYGVLNGPKPRLTEAQFASIVTKGARKMPAFGSVLSPSEIAQIAHTLKAMPR